MADNLPQEQIAGIKQMFHMMDTDKNGNLTFEELKDGLQMIGHPVADPDVQMLMDAVSFFLELKTYRSSQRRSLWYRFKFFVPRMNRVPIFRFLWVFF